MSNNINHYQHLILEIYKIPAFGSFDELLVDDWPTSCCDP